MSCTPIGGAVFAATTWVGSRDKRVYALDRATGKRVWDFATDGRVDSSPVVAGQRVYFGSQAGWIETPILSRADLATPRQGPAVIEEYDATCVVPPGARASLDAWGNIVMEV